MISDNRVKYTWKGRVGDSAVYSKRFVNMSWGGLEENKCYQLVEEQVCEVESGSRTVRRTVNVRSYKK